MADIKEPGRAINTAANKVEGGVHSVVDAVRDNAKSAVDAAGDFADTAKQHVRQWAGDARHSALKAEDKIEHWAGDAARVTGDKAEELGTELTALVRKYPVQALLVGFGIGLLCGRAVKA